MTAGGHPGLPALTGGIFCRAVPLICTAGALHGQYAARR
jgi:hypothetical protein